MEPAKEGSSVSQAPLLIGSSNYAYWKAYMKAFIMSIDAAAWEAIEEGWTQPTVIGADGTSQSKGKA